MQTIHSRRCVIGPVATIAFGVAVLSAPACSNRPDAPTLTGPTVVQPPPPPTPGSIAAGPSAAVLAMSSVNVTVGTNADEPGTFYLNARFTLTETGGKSGATIQDVTTSVDGGESSSTGPSCWRTPIRVAPGSTTDAFDAGWNDLLYCAPFAAGRVPAAVTISVSFTDDEGRFGSIVTTTIVTR